ncbi:MAG: hypothetical protein ACXU86_22950 [Archangium sp.]
MASSNPLAGAQPRRLLVEGYFDLNPADYQLLWDWVAQGAPQQAPAMEPMTRLPW